MVLETINIRYAHVAGHTDVCYGSDNRNILTCGSDGNVRIFNGSDDDDPSADSVSEMTLAVVCTKDQFLVATDSNYVQAFTYPERKRDKIIFRFSAPVTHMAVSASGKFLAACSCDMEVQILNTETNKITMFTGHTAPVLGVSLDPLDEFLVSSSCDGTIKIWDIATGSLIKTIHEAVPIKNDFFKAICLGRTAWKSFSGSLVAVPQDLEVITYKRRSWEVAYKLTSKNIEKSLSTVLFSPCGNYLAGASISGDIIIWEVKHKSEVCHYKDPKKVGICGVVWHPDGNEIAFTDRLGRLGVLTGIDEEISKHVPTNESEDISQADDIGDVLSNPMDTNGLFDDDEDDENCISLEKIKAPYKNESEDEEGPKSPASNSSIRTTKELIVPLPKPQAPFQPSSTPSHFEPRCLCFNAIGIVRYYDSDKTVDVQFHDTMFHHALFLRSFGVCTMAALSMNVLCLAVPSVEENLSKLSCVPLSSWDGCKEWTVCMAENEDILALAAAGSWVAVATNANQMRIFTHAGTQKQIVSLPGPVVCMSGYEQKILLVCHMGMGVFDSQNEGFILYQVSNLNVRALTPFQPVPLFPKSVLRWAGFTDEGTPSTYDSEGILRLLGHDLLHWEVVCDTRNQRKSPGDHCFIIGLSERYQNVRCVLCRNSQYPLIINTPTVVEIPLKLPFCSLETEKSVQEEVFWRLMFSLHTLNNVSGDKTEYQGEISSFEQTLKQTALKLFAEACRNSEDVRALDIATFMSSHPLELSVKYASKAGKMYLAEKLNGINPLDWRDQYSDLENKLLKNDEPESHFGDDLHKTVYSQQDLFEDYPESVEKENRKKEGLNVNNGEASNLAETQMQPSVNPFRKAQVQQKTLKGLKFFDTLTREQPKPNKPQVLNKPLKLKSISLTKNKGCESKNKKPTFVQWFSTEKTSLAEEYPNISACELTKLGMKIYKEAMSGSTVEEPNFSVTESKKRGLEGENESENKKCKSLDETVK